MNWPGHFKAVIKKNRLIIFLFAKINSNNRYNIILVFNKYRLMYFFVWLVIVYIVKCQPFRLPLWDGTNSAAIDLT